MKFCCSWLIFLFLSFTFLPDITLGQEKEYFDGTIIIKYKSDRRLRTIQSQANIDPEEDIRQMLQRARATSMQPVWSFNTTTHFRLKNSAQVQKAANNLQRIYEVRYSSNTDAAVLAAKMEQLAGIEYAEPKYIRRMQFSPNDSVTNPYQNVHRFEEAWNVTKGSSNVVVAVVDGGVNYLHFDLDEKLWINTDEVAAAVRGQVDQNSNGTITSAEVKQYLSQQNGDYNGDGTITLRDALAQGSPLLTGSDTDGNGLADDIYGWDYWAGGGVNGQPITQDNDPIADGTDHGAHVTGIAAAETNNGQGIAGTGFNIRYMALKTGGIPDDPSTTVDESRAIGFGYEGIIYAAQQGADIINCSWGGGGFSEFENEVINFATEMGALVIAAAGNMGSNSVDFPSGYANTLSVGSIDASEQVSSFSNVGYNIDVFATGSGIESTGFRDAIVTKSGTSMSTPAAAGLAGLIKSVHPDWSPQHIAAQIRSSARFINSSNNRQGHGIIDAFKAVSTNLPGVRVIASYFEDLNGDKLGLGEDGTITLEVINYGNTASNLSLQLTSLAPQGISLSQSSKSIGSLATGESRDVIFSISISETYDLNIIPTFRLDIASSNQSYEDFDIIQYSDILFDVVDANNIKMSFAGDGTIGYVDAFAARGGVGFVPLTTGDADFTEAENTLFEGGLMIEANNNIFDAVRGTGNQIVKDFEPLQTFVVTEDGISDQNGNTVFSFQDEAGTAAGRVRLQTFAFDDPALRNVVYLKYSVTNTSFTQPLKEVYIGLFNDWDIGANISNNEIAYSEQDSILYISSGSETADDPIIAVAHLGAISSALAINNFPTTTPTNPPVDLNDGFDDTEKKAALKAGASQTAISGADVSAVTASGPYTLNPKATLTAGFVYAFGNNLDQLRSQIQSARQQMPFTVSRTGIVISNRIPEETDLLQNAPNPFSEETTIRLGLSEDADMKLVVYDVLGREVDVLRDEHLQAGEYFIPFNPKNLSSGVYFVRLITDLKTKTISITYIK